MTDRYYPEVLEELCLTSVHHIASRTTLMDQLRRLSFKDLDSLAVHLRLVPPMNQRTIESSNDLFASGSGELNEELLLEIFACEYCVPHTPLDSINSLSLLPDEQTLWSGSLVPTSTVTALPKLNLQFLSFHDYLARNFELYRRETCYQIYGDLSEAIVRMRARLDMNGKTTFTGKSRMAVPIQSFAVTEVQRAHVGEMALAEVRADVSFTIHGLRGDTRQAWESLHEHDILFLVRIEAKNRDAGEYSYGQEVKMEEEHVCQYENDASFLEQEGVVFVRGCEVIRMEDEDGVVLNDWSSPDIREKRAGKRRLLRVRLDPIQYQNDMERLATGVIPDPYDSFNLLIRRDPIANNFKSVLQTTRNLLNLTDMKKSLPFWLQQVFLGIGDPSAAHYSNLTSSQTLDFSDTFLSAAHVIAAFPRYSVVFRTKSGESLTPESAHPPYRITFSEESTELICTCYPAPSSNPYLPHELQDEAESRGNSIEFTEAQVEAIRSGMSTGLTMIVGPPGTGKTDVAVQIISNLYHSYPEQRILVITRSNHALNDLFSKIAERAIQPRHVLRLGMGERELESDKDYSRLGRVEYCLQRRDQLLTVVKRLAVSLGCSEDVAYSCETADSFYVSTIIPRMQLFLRALQGGCKKEELDQLRLLPIGCTPKQKEEEKHWFELNSGEIANLFPFKLFFLPLSQPLFSSTQSESDQHQVYEDCFHCLRDIFTELKEYRAFELVRSSRPRCEYMLASEARIVAMTCTHAAIARQRLIESGFYFDTLVIEEAGQVLELESFIPLFLQV